MECHNCKTHFPIKIKIDGRIRNLKNRKYCFTCSPFGSGNRKILDQDPKVHKNKLIGIKDPNRTCYLCGKKSSGKRLCSACRTKLRRHRCKLAAIKLLGGKCNRCGWSGNIAGFEFHHKDPLKKDFTIGSSSNRSWDFVKNELIKCELLCSICHRTEHSDRDDDVFLQEVYNYSGPLDI